MPTQSLSLEEYKLLDDAYNFFNKKLFSDTLPPCMIVLHRRRNARGYFHAERYFDKSSKSKKVQSIDELAMNPDDFDRPDISILSTLVHEMAHVWRHRCSDKKPSRGGYHDKVWANKMEEIGLMPSSTGAEGGKKTGQKVTHYIIKSGKFETLCLSFLKGRKIQLSSFPMPSLSESKGKNKIKYSCSCGINIWGKPNLDISCNQCNESFVEV